MAKKEFSKFFIASLKRTAQNVSPLVRRKQKLQAEIAEREEELKSIQIQIDAHEAPIKEATDGYGTEDLVIRTVEVTDKLDKDGKPVKVTKWNLKYPETIVPVEEAVAEAPAEVAETTDTEEGDPLASEVVEPEYPNLD
jgi:ribosomal protein L9